MCGTYGVAMNMMHWHSKIAMCNLIRFDSIEMRPILKCGSFSNTNQQASHYDNLPTRSMELKRASFYIRISFFVCDCNLF